MFPHNLKCCYNFLELLCYNLKLIQVVDKVLQFFLSKNFVVAIHNYMLIIHQALFSSEATKNLG